MSIKRKGPFISMPAFNQGARELEKETKSRLGITPEIKNDSSLSDRVEASKEIITLTPDPKAEEIESTTEVARPEKQFKKEKGKNQRIRFANTLEEYVPAKYIKSGTISTVKAHEKILTQFKMLSIEKKMSVEDLFNLAAFSFLSNKKYVKDELIKPFDL